MKRSAAFLASAFLASISATSAAAVPSLDKFCVPGPDGQPAFDPRKLMTAVLDQYQPSRAAFDVDGDGTETYLERLTVVLTDDCEGKMRCSADLDKISKIRLALLGVLASDDLTFTRLRPSPTGDEIDKEKWLSFAVEAGRPGSISELLDPQHRFLAVTCKTTTATARAAGGGSVRNAATSGEAPADKNARGPLRVTSKLEDLTVDFPDGKKLASVDSATFSIVNDNVGDKLTFSIDGIVGYSIPVTTTVEKLIPFVQYQRTSVRDRSATPPTTKRSPDKLAFGVMSSFAFTRYEVADFAPEYVIDYEKGSRVLSIKANWIPSFVGDVPGVGILHAGPLIKSALWYRVVPRALFQGSHVFDAGTNTDLLTTSNYLRAGGDVSLDLWGIGPLDRFTASASYKRLWRFTRGPRDVSLFKTSLEYWLDSEQHVSVSYIYEHGTDEDTTTRVNNWKIALGVRF